MSLANFRRDKMKAISAEVYSLGCVRVSGRRRRGTQPAELGQRGGIGPS